MVLNYVTKNGMRYSASMVCSRSIVVSFGRFTVTSWAGNSNRPASVAAIELVLLLFGVWRLVVTVTVLIDFQDHRCLL